MRVHEIILMMVVVMGRSDGVTIVVDPGHGDADLGAVSGKGVREKDVTLQYAKLFVDRAAVTDPSWKVLVTRQGDESVTEDQRATLSNQTHADVYLSLHLDAAPSMTLSGVKVWVWKAGSPAKKVQTYVKPVLWDLVQAGMVRESRRLANAMIEEWHQGADEAVRGIPKDMWDSTMDMIIGQAPHRALRGVAAPAVAVTLGYLTSEFDEQRVEDATWKASVVDTLVRGVRRFVQQGRP